MINPKWLNTFCTLCELGHFTHTAEKLFMTQSGVSQHIKKLEQQLDTILLLREGKTFSVTDAGRQLHQKGQLLLRTFEELEQTIKEDDQYKGIVKISSPGSIGLKLYPYLLDIQKTYPELIIDYSFASNKGIEQDLNSRHIELGLMTDLPKQDNLVGEKIGQETLVLVTPAGIEEINWQTLLELGFIAHPDAKHHGQLLLSENFEQFQHISQFEHNGFSNQIGLILKPVSLGIGFTILPLYAAKAFHQQQLINIHYLNTPVSVPIYLCYNRLSFDNSRKKFIREKITSFLR